MCEIDEMPQEEPTFDGPINPELSSQIIPEAPAGPMDDSTLTPVQTLAPGLYECSTSEFHPNLDDPYNPTEKNENELGSCDCRSECKYNTGESWKYSNYGYSD